MTTAQNPPDQTNAEEVSLEDIDKLLESEDPEFAKQMADVRAVEIDKTINIESAVSGDENLGSEIKQPTDDKGESRAVRIRAWLRIKIANAKVVLKNRAIVAWRDFLVWLKVRPKEYFFYSIAIARMLVIKASIPVSAFRHATTGQKLAVLTLVAMSAATIWVLRSNFRGIWIPQINEAMLQTFEDHADFVEKYDPKDGGESFYSAFPQERHEFLFRKMKVNLRRTEGHPLPMGAFEIIVQVDSLDTAIEVRDREVEFFDDLQRVFEEESFTDLESDLGKGKLKGRLKRELNQKLTQGWVKDITFKTFVLKP